MGFYEKKAADLFPPEQSSAERYIEKCAQTIAQGVIEDKRRGIPPDKAIKHMMAKFNKCKRRNRDEPKKLEAIRKRIVEILQASPEMQASNKKVIVEATTHGQG